MIDGLHAAYSGVAAFGKKAEASSHNIANAQTDGFRKSRVILEEAKNGGVSAEVHETKAPEAVPVPVQSSAESEPSNTDLGEEMVELGLAQRLLEANVASLKTQDETVGTLLDIMA